ncbi:MAG: hypothetical protein ONB13_09545 [candidate division KSB1 bacterium]|nr:hypothetical protein [candidate division KSB1 bacterium]
MIYERAITQFKSKMFLYIQIYWLSLIIKSLYEAISWYDKFGQKLDNAFLNLLMGQSKGLELELALP